jgi:lysophospholipase L1-like esterase
MAAFGSLAAVELLGADHANAAPAGPTATRISVIGDSLTVGTLPYQADAFTRFGWGNTAIDAHNSRGVRTKAKSDSHTGLTAIGSIRSKSGDSELWVIALGTDDAGIAGQPRYADLIASMMNRIGTGHYVMWVNIFLPLNPPRQEYWNTSLAKAANDRPDELFVFDWASIAAENPTWLVEDQVHYTGEGYWQRSALIAEATRTLIPPVPARKRRMWTQIPAA